LRTIFISYRRSDSEGEAGRLFDDLAGRFTEQAVFMDVDAIQPGRDFRKAIEENIRVCSVLLAIVGPQWLDSVDELGKRRLDDADDYLRLEIASALKRDIPVVPVLVRGAKMPRPNLLPADLQELAYRNGVEVSHARWKSDMQVLLRALEPHLEIAAQASLPITERAPMLPASGPAIENAVIDRVGKELAHYIGPIAEIVVKRAAKRCATPSELCESIANEIESPSDRAKFLARCGYQPAPE
jgi:hypothetical protein